MNTLVKGAKAGKKESRKAVIAADSAQSKTYIKILYGLSEGEVEGLANGLQSIYLEDTPLQNPQDGLNFSNLSSFFRHGTNDQEHIEGFPDISSETHIGVELKSSAPWVKSITNADLDAVSVRLKWGALRQTNDANGDVYGYTIQYAIELQTDGATWEEVLNTRISDKTSTNYERAHRIELPRANIGWTIRVRRLTENSESEYINDKMYIEALTEIIDLKLNYPNTALLGLHYDAETFSNVAKIAVDLKGVKVKVPSNYDPIVRTYIGLWDGTFKRAYTNNPAWIYYDICTSKRYALGDRLTQLMIDKWSLYRLAQYCDQMVSDGKGGQEPRFTCNIYLQSTEDAFAILTKLAGVFRAISYWNGTSIVCDADIPQDTFFTYTRANVIDGVFEYTGTRARDRHTIAKVAWDNPANHYKTEHVFIRDEDAIARLGVRIAEIDAWGCTSEGQAQRAGHWALKSEQLETRTVTFKVGLDGHIPQPGKVIEIADELFAGRANGGRISKVSANLRSITIDRDDVVCCAGDRLVVNGDDGKAEARIVESIIGREIKVVSAFSHASAQNVWVVDAQDLKTMKFRVMSIVQNEQHQFTITALQYEDTKFDAIDHGAFIEDRPISIINTPTQAAVSNVVISAETMVQQGLSVVTMLISWDQTEGATKYQVEWRKDDGSWIKMPVVGSNSVEVQGIYAGQYEARVTAMNAFDSVSLPTYSNLTTLEGKQGLPPALAHIATTGILFGYRLNWNFPATGALDTAYTEIEISSSADGANAAQLGLFAYPTDTHVIQGMQPNLTRWFRGRLIDRIGNVGPWSDRIGATTSADASAVLDLLSDQISESQLSQDLKTEIGKLSDLNEAFAGVNKQVNQIADDQKLLAKTVDTVQTSVDDYVASVQEVSESIDGLYAQNFTKIDVNGKVIGWGGANDGVEGKFIFNVDSLAIGSGDSNGYYPFNFRTTAYTDPVTKTVFPVGAYLDTAFIDYASIDTAHIKSLAVTTAQIGDLAVDTLKIQDNAVTVPIGATWGTATGLPDFNNQLLDEASIQAWFNWSFNNDLAAITLDRSGGKVAISGSLTLDEYPVFGYLNGQTYAGIGAVVSLVIGVFRDGVELARHFLPPSWVSGYAIKFSGSYTLPTFIDDAPRTGTTKYTLKVAIGRNRASISGIKASYTYKDINVPTPLVFTSRSMLVLELKK